MSASEQIPKVLLLIHGTGAASPEGEEVGTRWYQKGSRFATDLLGRPSGQKVFSHDTVFHWSGANSEKARRNAGAKLRAQLLTLEAAGVSYHLVGHSHGGSVIRHALRDAHEYKHLISIVTVGTPFLAFRASRFGIFMLFPFFLSALFLKFSWSDWFIYFQYFNNVLAQNDYIALVALPFLWLSSLVAFIGSSILLFRSIAATLRVSQMRRADTRMWKRYGTRWKIVAADQDEAINGLSQVVVSTPPAVLRSASRLWPVRLVQIVVNDFVWHICVRSAFGADVSGETICMVSILPVPGVVNEYSLPNKANDALVNKANKCALESISELRQALGNALTASSIPSGAFATVASSVTWDALVHTSYFDCQEVRDEIFKLLSNVNTTGAAFAKGDSSAFRVAGEKWALDRLAFAFCLLFALSCWMIFSSAKSLYAARVSNLTPANKIGRIIADAAVREAVQSESLRAVHAWLSALTVVDPSATQAAKQLITDGLRVKGGTNQGAFQACLSVLEDLPDSFDPNEFAKKWTRSDDADRQHQFLENVSSMLRKAKYFKAARIVLPAPDLDEPMAELKEDSNLNTQPSISYEDLLVHSLKSAEVANLKQAVDFWNTADALQGRFKDFPDIDDALDAAGKRARRIVRLLAKVGGESIAREFCEKVDKYSMRLWLKGENMALDPDDNPDVLQMELVVGLLAGNDYVAAFNQAKALKSSYSQLRTEALARVAQFAPMPIAKEAWELIASELVESQAEDVLRDSLMLFEARADRLWTYPRLSVQAVNRYLESDRRNNADGRLIAQQLAIDGYIGQALKLASGGENLSSNLNSFWASSPATFQATEYQMGLTLLRTVELQPANKTNSYFIETRRPDEVSGNPVWAELRAGKLEKLRTLGNDDLKVALIRCIDFFPYPSDLLIYAELLPTQSDRFLALASIAQKLESQGKRSRATEVWRRAAEIALRSSDVEHLGHVAQKLAALGDTDSAMRFAERCTPDWKLRISAATILSLSQ